MRILDTFNKSVQLLLLVAAMLLAPAASECVAQTGTVDDSTVFAIFVNIFDNLQKEVVRRANEIDPRTGRNIGKDFKDSVVKRLGFDNESEYEKARVVLADIKSRIEDLDKEARAYFEKCRASGQQPDPNIAEQFWARHKEIRAAGVEALKKGLSSSSWKGLQNYLNTQVKPNIKRMDRAN